MKWFRFYSEFRADPKLKRMPIHHRYAFVILLCLASEGETRGVISGLDDDDIAFELEMPTEDWLTLKAKFKTKGLIRWEGDLIFITNWDKRQFASDSSAERVAKHRAKQKQKECNVTAPLLKRHVTPSDPDPDPDPESKKSISVTQPSFDLEVEVEDKPQQTQRSDEVDKPKSPRTREQKRAYYNKKYLAEFEAGFWNAVLPGKKTGKVDAIFTYGEYREAGVSATDITTAYLYDCKTWEQEGRSSKYIPAPQAWLNKKRWCDDDWRAMQSPLTASQEDCEVWEQFNQMAKQTGHTVEEREGLQGGRFFLDGKIEIKDPDKLKRYMNLWQQKSLRKSA